MSERRPPGAPVPWERRLPRPLRMLVPSGVEIAILGYFTCLALGAPLAVRECLVALAVLVSCCGVVVHVQGVLCRRGCRGEQRD